MRSSVKAANDNRNDELIGRTREVWQPRLGRDVTRDEAVKENVVGTMATVLTAAKPLASTKVLVLVNLPLAGLSCA